MVGRKDGFSGERALALPQPVVSEMEKDPYASVLHITEIGYYPQAHLHLRLRGKPINQHVFIYCVEGDGWFKLNGEKHIVQANHYFILPAGVPHAYGAGDATPWTIYWIHFRGKLASSFSAGQPYPIEIKSGLHSRISDRIELFEEIFRTLEMGYSRESLLYACTAFHHYLGTLRHMQSFRDAVANPARQADVIMAAIHFMKENVEKKLSMNDIVQHIGYSPSHFTVLFGQRTGYTPLAYFNRLKIRQACKLLDFTDMKINQISYKIGIGDTYYFSRLFTKIMGLSPKAYKKLKKG